MDQSSRSSESQTAHSRNDHLDAAAYMAALTEACDFISKRTSLRPRFGITLGSGLASLVDAMEVEVSIPYREVPHFSPSTVEGHPGQLIVGRLHNIPLLVLQGRIHYYEGHSPWQVVFPTRVLGQLGVKSLILTNAAGGLDPTMKPGDLMLINDHINFTGYNPLVGPNLEALGTRFPDMSEVYDRKLVNLAKSVLVSLGIRHRVGVYCGVSGPSYETTAEIRFYQAMGAHAVGMSTVPEAIAAKHMGMQLLGISCITNLGTGILSQPITHEEVKEVAKRSEKAFVQAMQDIVSKMDEGAG